ncbi:MAG: PsiF family protein [Candidatus Accumulibacter sp.]|nr:PsiF family protein [Accumulibacter sp.]
MTALVASTVFALSMGSAGAAEAEVEAEVKAEAEAEVKAEVKAETKAEVKAETKAKKEKKAPSPAQIAQREKMKLCNAEAKQQGLKGDERKKFMSGCLKRGSEK